MISKNFKGLKVLTAGIPLSTPHPQTIYKGIDRIVELELDGMEIEFVHGVRTKDSEMIKIGEYGKNKNIVFTAHAPYYINLNAKEKEKYIKSKEHIKKTIMALEKANGWSMVFHPAFYLEDHPHIVLSKVIKAIEEINSELKELGHNFNVWIRPETMGKPSQFGSLEEVVEVSKHFDNVLPCIDFSHLYARTIGGYNTEKEIYEIFEYIGKELGDQALKNMHIHLSGIEYGPKGEKFHNTFDETKFNYKFVIKALKYFEVEGVIISESSNIEYDALIIKNLYNSENVE
ncbi:MAG: TIM barrel protein [Brevinematales bacterium]|nr:TIM barrel protein [Brevinematales bacterium]